MPNFLSDMNLRPLNLSEERGLKPIGLFLGNGPNALEVAITESSVAPPLSTLRAAWKSRLAGRATPLILVSVYGQKAALCGPAGEPPPAFVGIDLQRVERICRSALSEPDRHSALRFLHTCIPDVEAPLAGLRNEGAYSGEADQHSGLKPIRIPGR